MDIETESQAQLAWGLVSATLQEGPNSQDSVSGWGGGLVRGRGSRQLVKACGVRRWCDQAGRVGP